jgi:ABC-2 type transport system ATP-binding protein
MTVAIQVARLRKHFGTVQALAGVDLDVGEGEFFGLLGPNGAGKTTTLRVLTTLVRPTSGHAEVCGFDVVRQPLDVRRRVVVVIQEQAAELLLSVRENLLTFARFHGLRGAEIRLRADAALRDLGLLPEANRKVQDLSGGYRRRVQVAKVFMVDAPVVFLDEFSTGMDPALKRSVMELLRREVARGRTIVLTTHILSEAEELCDDILIIDRGRQLARGDINSLKLLSERVYELTLTFDRLPEDLDTLVAGHRPLRMRVHGSTVELALQDEESRILTLAASLASRRRLLRIELTSASLEDVFIELTQKGAPS